MVHECLNVLPTIRPARVARPASFKKRALRLAALSLAAAATVACASPEQRAEKYYASGVQLMEEGDLARANIQFRNVLKINEEHVPSLEAMAKIAEQRQDYKTMFAIVQRIVRLQPDNIDAQLKLGRFYLIGSDETGALEQVEKILAMDPGNIDAVALKAGVQLRLGDTAGAVALARQVAAADPANPEAATVLATERALAEDFEGAVAELDRALEAKADAAILQLLRIRMLAQLGRIDAVLDGFKRLVEEHPDVADYRRVYAAELVKQKQYGEAQRQMEATVALEPANVQTKLDVIRLVKAQGGAESALRKLRDYVAAEPGNFALKFALSDFHAGEKSWDEAIETLRPLEKASDATVAAEAKNKLAAIWIMRGDSAKAEALIKEIFALDATNTDALLKRARLRFEARDFDEAVTDLRTALNNDPDSYQAMLLMASVFEAQENFEFAQAELAKSFEASQKNPRVANVFARFLMQRKNLPRAEDILEQSLAKYANDLENLRLLANIRLHQQDWAGAEEVASIVELIDRDDDAGLARDIRAVALTGLEEYDKVIDLLSARHKQAPLQSRPLTALVSAYLRAGRRAEAESLLTEMIKSDPGAYDARILIARVYGERGNAAAAEQALIEASNIDASRPEAFELLYRHYAQSNQLDEAEKLLEDGLARAPDNIALRFFRADILLNKGAREEALAIYADLVEKRPNDKIVANNFVSLLNELHQDEASAARALKVARVIENENHPFFRDTLGWANYRAGKFRQAVEYLSQAAAAAENNGEILYHLGAAQIAAGDPESGRANLEKALAAGGENFRYEAAVRDLLRQT